MYHWGHLYLAYPHPPLEFGAFIADAVKGKNWQAYPPPIAEGIRFHRLIDQKTDHQPHFSAIAHILRQTIPRYGRVLADWVLDYYLIVAKESELLTLLKHLQDHFPAYEVYLPASWQSFYQRAILQGELLSMKTQEGFFRWLSEYLRRRALPVSISQIQQVWAKHEKALCAHAFYFWQEAYTWTYANLGKLP